MKMIPIEDSSKFMERRKPEKLRSKVNAGRSYAKNNRIMYPNDEADSRCVKNCYADLSSVT